MRFPYKSALIACLTVPLIAGCGTIVKKADYAPSPNISETANPIPVQFSGIELLLPPGMNIGRQRAGRLCVSPAYPINRNSINKEIDRKFLRQNFHDALEANGYDVVGSLDIAFEPDNEEQRAEYSIKGKVKDVQLDLCRSSALAPNWLYPVPGEKGEMYVSIDWSVYDRLRRTTVYKTTTKGYAKRRVPNQEGISLLFHDAFDMAAHNLAADTSFHDLIIKGVKPTRDAGFNDYEENKEDTRPRIFNPDEDVTLGNKPLSRQPFAKTADTARNTAVMIQKFGHGSGFFITDEGHILTNAHVVGDARRMRIVTNARKTGLTAEVLRVDHIRDIALLRLEEIPEWLEIQTFPIRLDWPKVGEDIYAIGVPQNANKYRGTVTKGIVSAHRRNYKVDGARKNFIQGDVEIHPGSSGGPLLDENGNLVGVAVRGHTFGVEDVRLGVGLNLFIPIQEALDRLGIAY